MVFVSLIKYDNGKFDMLLSKDLEVVCGEAPKSSTDEYLFHGIHSIYCDGDGKIIVEMHNYPNDVTIDVKYKDMVEFEVHKIKPDNSSKWEYLFQDKKCDNSKCGFSLRVEDLKDDD